MEKVNDSSGKAPKGMGASNADKTKAKGKRIESPIIDSIAPGSMNLTHEDMDPFEADVDARQFDMAMEDELSLIMEEESFESLVPALKLATQKIKELCDRGALPESEQMTILLKNPGNAELWKRLAIQIQVADEEEYELITVEDVQDFLEIAVGLNPSGVEMASELGQYLLAVTGEFEDAHTIISGARDLCLLQLEECTAGMATSLLEKGQLKEARKILEQTLMICPEADELLDMLEDVKEIDSGV